MRNLKIIAIGTCSILLSACSGFFDKDNTPPPSPLANFKSEVNVQSLWSTSTGSSVGDEYLKLAPSVGNRAIITAGKSGSVTATEITTGRNLWSVNTNAEITGSPHVHDNIVYVGGRDGEVIALRQTDGKQLWKTRVSSEVLASPAASDGVTLVKAIDGTLTAFSSDAGHALWHYEQTEPTLILRSASAPQIAHNNVIVGFANGNLVKLTLQDGNLHWQQAITLPEGSFQIQRMIDIDADPIVMNNRIYAATYQGRIAAMDFSSGKTFWTHDISSYSGIAADHERVYVSDAKSHIWAFDADSGTVDWRQKQLEFRNITGPALIGNYVVVGDGEGYLHWMNKQDGRFVARIHVSSAGILATPVVENNILYVLAKDGHLAAYRLG